MSEREQVEKAKKVLTVADIKAMTAGFHRCGWDVGPVKNLNPECGCMCGMVYNEEGEPIIGHYGRHSGVRCQHADERGRLRVIGKDGQPPPSRLPAPVSQPVEAAQKEAETEFFHAEDCPCYSEQHSQDCCECQCQRPPKGWRCTREVGHAGSCAAVPVSPQADPSESARVKSYENCSIADAQAAEQYAIAYVCKVGVSRETMIDAISTLRAQVMAYESASASQPSTPPQSSQLPEVSSEIDGVLSRHRKVVEELADGWTAAQSQPVAEIPELVDAINWLMGCGDSDFVKPEGATTYWFRSEFKKRAGLEYDGEKYVLSSDRRRFGKKERV